MSRSNSTLLRVSLALGGLLGGIFLSGWIAVIAIIVLAFVWPSWEALLLGLFMDFLWLPSGQIPFFTLGAIIAVWIMEPIRKEFLI